MRNIFLLLFGLVIFLAGCSSTYTLKDYPSKQKFYEDFNNFAKDKNVNVTLINDSTFNTNNKGAYVEKNSLSSFLTRTIIDTTLPLNKVKHINFGTNFNISSAGIKLTDGNLVNAENVRMSKDSVEFNTTLPYLYSILLNKVKQVSYNKRWIGIIEGIGLGFLTSSIVAYGGIAGNSSQTGFFGAGFAIFPGIPLSTILGGVIGWLIGHNFTYQFNP